MSHVLGRIQNTCQTCVLAYHVFDTWEMDTRALGDMSYYLVWYHLCWMLSLFPHIWHVRWHSLGLLTGSFPPSWWWLAIVDTFSLVLMLLSWIDGLLGSWLVELAWRLDYMWITFMWKLILYFDEILHMEGLFYTYLLVFCDEYPPFGGLFELCTLI